MRDHKMLRAFELARALVAAVYGGTQSFPSDERFGLVCPMRRAAVPVASNIVEGCGRGSKADYIRILDRAYGSCHEIEYQLSLAYRLGYLWKDSFDELEPLAEETARVLNGLIRSLRKG